MDKVYVVVARIEGVLRSRAFPSRDEADDLAEAWFSIAEVDSVRVYVEAWEPEEA